MKYKKLTLWLVIVVSFYCVLLATTDYSKLAFYLLIGVAVYFGLLKTFPGLARFWLSVGGAIGGSILVGALTLYLIGLFWKGWDGFGIALWVGLPMGVIGGVLGVWVVGLLTEPPKTDTSATDNKS